MYFRLGQRDFFLSFISIVIIIGSVLLLTQKLWLPKVADLLLGKESQMTISTPVSTEHVDVVALNNEIEAVIQKEEIITDYSLPHDDGTHNPPSIPLAPDVPKVIKKPTSKITGIELPPVPDPSLVDLVLVGVDVNNNDVRDEIEHFIASKVDNKEDYLLALGFAKALCLNSSFPLTGTKADVEAIVLLLGDNENFDKARKNLNYELQDEIREMVLNTTERESRFYQVIGIMFNPDSAIEPQKCSPPSTLFGVPIPPEPNKDANDSTLLGIDSNKNHVRDDVERLIACNVKSLNDFKASLAGAREYQRMLEWPEEVIPEKDMLGIYSDLYCAEDRMETYDDSWQFERHLGQAIFNTEMRVNTYLVKSSDFGGFFGSELTPCSVEVI